MMSSVLLGPEPWKISLGNLGFYIVTDCHSLIWVGHWQKMSRGQAHSETGSGPHSTLNAPPLPLLRPLRPSRAFPSVVVVANDVRRRQPFGSLRLLFLSFATTAIAQAAKSLSYFSGARQQLRTLRAHRGRAGGHHSQQQRIECE